MPINTYSATASLNTSVGGVSIAEGCPPGNVNDGIRAVMADLRTWYDGFSVPALSVTGNTSLGDASGDVVTINAQSVIAPNALTFTTPGASFTNTTDARNRGFFAGPAVAVRVGMDATQGYVEAVSPDETTFKPLVFGGSVHQWDISGTPELLLNSTELYPATDIGQNLGAASFRYGTVYASTGSINTSDAREKAWRGALTAAELNAARRIAREIGAYQWLSALAEKGEGARLHIGVKAQRVGEILAEEGLDPHAYGFFCYDTFEGGDRYGIRPDELLFFILAAQEQRLAALEF